MDVRNCLFLHSILQAHRLRQTKWFAFKMGRLVLKFCCLFALLLIVNLAHAEDEDTGKPEMSTARYLTGGILSTTIGFGTGHVVQGRWLEKGWIFSSGEILAAAVVGIGLASCQTSNAKTDSSNCSNMTALGVGAGGLVGFRIWEIYDSWVGAVPMDEPPPAVYLTPRPHETSFIVAWRF